MLLFSSNVGFFKKSALLMCCMMLTITVCMAQENSAASSGAAENWRAKVGAAVASPDTIKALMASVPANEQMALIQELMTAAAASPGDGDTRLAVIKVVAVNCIAAVNVNNKVAAISEVIATTPVAYLPHLCSDLAARFAPQANNLTQSQFQAVGEQVIQKVSERVSGSEDVNVRTACAVACFLSSTTGASDPILPALMANIPTSEASKPDVVRNLALSIAAGDPAPVYAAAKVEAVVTTPLTTTAPATTTQQGTTQTTGQQQQGTTTTTEGQTTTQSSQEGGITLQTQLPSYLAVSGHASQDGLLAEFGSSSSSGSGQTASGNAGSSNAGGSTSTTPEGIQVVPTTPTCSDVNTLVP